MMRFSQSTLSEQHHACAEDHRSSFQQPLQTAAVKVSVGRTRTPLYRSLGRSGVRSEAAISGTEGLLTLAGTGAFRAVLVSRNMPTEILLKLGC